MTYPSDLALAGAMNHKARRSRCQRKSRYLDAEVAADAMKRMQRRQPDAMFNVYTCPVCDYLHVGRTGTRAEAERQRAITHIAEMEAAIRRLKEARGW